MSNKQSQTVTAQSPLVAGMPTLYSRHEKGDVRHTTQRVSPLIILKQETDVADKSGHSLPKISPDISLMLH